jgi:hypothetical protein
MLDETSIDAAPLRLNSHDFLSTGDPQPPAVCM